MRTRFTLFFLLALSIGLRSQFNYFYGNIHSQSSYSDGNQDSATSLMTKPLQNFNYAKLSLHTDFYGISDHNHLSAGMTNPAHFHFGVADANTANSDGSFVALYGQEWGVIAGGGHVIVYGMDSLMGWDAGDYDIYVAQNNYAGLWSKIAARPAAFAYLAHPQTTDYTNLFTTTITPVADNAIIGMAARSGPAFSTDNTYTNPSASDYTPRYKEALSLGYHLGIGLDHDTHNSVFGRQTAGRLVVMAPVLTRYNILDAFRKMRFYSSDDWNAKVDFSINTQPMGSIYSHVGTPTISVNVSDPDGEATSLIDVYYGVPGSGSLPTILTSAAGTNTLNFNHNIANGLSYYYYLEIKQADGDVIWTSPIWYTRNNAIVANPPVTNFSFSAVGHCVGQPISLTDNSANVPTTWSWTTLGATTTSFTTQNPTVTYTAAGTYTIALISSNAIGTGLPLTKTITVTNSPTLTVSSASVCNGTSATLNVSGATTYTWNTGATTTSIAVTPSVTTIYTVTGTSGSCSKTSTTNVIVTPNPIVTAVSNASVICFGQSANLTAGGATTYTWNTGATTTSIAVSPTVTTNYTVTGKSGACSKTATTGVTVNPNPTVTAVNNASVICFGQSATLTAGGATTYTWNTGATTTSIAVSPTVTTNYTVTGSSLGCSKISTTSVSVSPGPTVTAVSNASLVCSGQSATLTASGAVSYTWSTGAMTAGTVITPTITTTYTVTGKNAAGCTKTFTISEAESACTGILNLNGSDPEAQVLPNPTSGEITISVNTVYENMFIEVYNSIGQMIKRSALLDLNTTLNLSDQSNGIYFVKLIQDQKMIFTKKIVKQN